MIVLLRIGALALLSPVTLGAGPQRAQAADSSAVQPARPDTAARDSVPVVIGNRVVVVLRASSPLASADERARFAALRIRAIAETLATVSPREAERRGEVEFSRDGDDAVVRLGPHAVYRIMPADVDTLRGETVAGVALRSATQLRAALRDIREERSPAYLARAVVLALIATVLFVGVLFALVHVRARGHAWVSRVRPTPRSAEGRTAVLTIPMSQLRMLIDRGVGLLTLAAAAFAAYMWIAYVLAQFPFSRPWGEALGGYLSASLSRLALSAVRAIPGLFTVMLIFIATRWVAGAVSAAFNAAALGRLKIPGVHPETAVATRRIVIVLVWLFGLMVAYPNIPGSDSDAFKGISVFAGLVFTLGSSGLVSQAMSGLVVLYSRAYRPGDFVRIGDDVEGRITKIGMLSTKLRNLRREEITLPNSVVLGAQVTNFSRLKDEGGPLLHTTVSVGYDAPWRQVEALLLMAAGRTDGLSVDEPPAFVLRTALGEFAVKYQLIARLVDPGRRAVTLSALHGHILDAFNEYGVQIVVPSYEGDPERSKVVPRERWYAAPAAGAEVDGAEVRR